MRIACIIQVLMLFATSCNVDMPHNADYEKNGLVADEKTALKIAEAIWLPIYGKKIYDNEPFKVQLQDSVWIVEGTVYTKLGGAPYITIRKRDAKILGCCHSY